MKLVLRYVPPARSRPALKAILEAATRKFEWGADVDLDAVVEQLRDGCTGADVAGVASAAWMKAARWKVACCCDSPQQGNHSLVVEQQDLIAAAACTVPNLTKQIWRDLTACTAASALGAAASDTVEFKS